MDINKGIYEHRRLNNIFEQQFSSDALKNLREVYMRIIEACSSGIIVKITNDQYKITNIRVYENHDKIVLYSYDYFYTRCIHENPNININIVEMFYMISYYYNNNFIGNTHSCIDCKKRINVSAVYNFIKDKLCQTCLIQYLPKIKHVYKTKDNIMIVCYFQYIENTINLWKIKINSRGILSDSYIYQYKYLSVNDSSLTTENQDIIFNIYWMRLRVKILLIDNIKFVCDIFNQEISGITKEVKLNFITSFGIY
jgi:hypothetical protein